MYTSSSSLLLFMQMSTSVTHLHRSHLLPQLMNDNIKFAPLVIVLLIHSTTTSWATNSQNDPQQQHQQQQQQQQLVQKSSKEINNLIPSHHHASSSSSAAHSAQLQQQQAVWDDPFGGGTNPILYMQSNRTPAYEDVRIIIIYIAFFTAYVAFLIIFPGIRQEKFSTLISVTVSLFVGVIILTSALGTDWQRAHATISSPYRAFSRERIFADLSVKIGLKSVNITLRAHRLPISSLFTSPIGSTPNDKNRPIPCLFASPTTQHQCQEQQQQQTNSSSKSHSQSINVIQQQHQQQHQQQQDADYYNDDINFNERFYWIEPTEMLQEFHRALERGLPYPILTVAEYLSQDEAGFSWSRQYRQAGYYADQLLWMAFATWIVMNVLLCSAPRYGVYTMLIVGFIMLGTNLLYWLLVPNNKHQLVIPFEGQYLTFKFGWSFWMVMIAGTISIFIGACFLLCFRLYPHYIFTTILDIDYDNHYQQHRRRNFLTLSSESSASTSASSSTAPSPSSSHYSTNPNHHRHHHHHYQQQQQQLKHQADVRIVKPQEHQVNHRHVPYQSSSVSSSLTSSLSHPPSKTASKYPTLEDNHHEVVVENDDDRLQLSAKKLWQDNKQIGKKQQQSQQSSLSENTLPIVDNHHHRQLNSGLYPPSHLPDDI